MWWLYDEEEDILWSHEFCLDECWYPLKRVIKNSFVYESELWGGGGGFIEK